ncbi:NAD-dependent protein deacetylase sirtuin-7 [Erpetoichthys calabaricus]|uniref:NAD-dependent protein deacetylase sirtuin-7 n=1 Tax=Erpetoichthys calabaricus TaxID=27687 RepID=UPI002234341A|nr:NAD-dependent protein deacetylase sirtuin-7 [Erpetoichthys calabaricus]
MEEAGRLGVLSREERKALEKAKILRQEKERDTFRRVSKILRKSEADRTKDEQEMLQQCEDTVQEMKLRKSKRDVLKRKQEEVLDDPDELKRKVKLLSAAVREAKHMVIYTGAGISTAASIPDYRGPNGVWTLLQKGRIVSATDLSEAEPTLTHMCIAKLYEEKLVNHVVSQNCDGLHLRSGLPRHALSELHGNMYIEVCTICSSLREYIRLFDVTERTALHRHGTGRLCHKCKGELRDTIVHFGERGTLEQPLNWKGAEAAAQKADVILCLGSSLKVLKKYACLWCMSRPPNKRPKLYIVNLQWTPKDDLAALKIHGKCDDVLKLLMEELNLELPVYDKAKDPIFGMSTSLRTEEAESHSRKLIAPPKVSEVLNQDQESSEGSTSVLGGWFGRGCSKGRKKKR